VGETGFEFQRQTSGNAIGRFNLRCRVSKKLKKSNDLEHVMTVEEFWGPETENARL
jgi:hypothetical protein